MKQCIKELSYLTNRIGSMNFLNDCSTAIIKLGKITSSMYSKNKKTPEKEKLD